MFTRREQEILSVLLREMIALNNETMQQINPAESPSMFGEASRDAAAASVLLGKVLMMTTVDEFPPLQSLYAASYVGPKCVHDFPLAIPVNDPRNCPICTRRKCLHGKPFTEPCLECGNPAAIERQPPEVPISVVDINGAEADDSLTRS